MSEQINDMPLLVGIMEDMGIREMLDAEVSVAGYRRRHAHRHLAALYGYFCISRVAGGHCCPQAP